MVSSALQGADSAFRDSQNPHTPSPCRSSALLAAKLVAKKNAPPVQASLAAPNVSLTYSAPVSRHTSPDSKRRSRDLSTSSLPPSRQHTVATPKSVRKSHKVQSTTDTPSKPVAMDPLRASLIAAANANQKSERTPGVKGALPRKNEDQYAPLRAAKLVTHPTTPLSSVPRTSVSAPLDFITSLNTSAGSPAQHESSSSPQETTPDAAFIAATEAGKRAPPPTTTTFATATQTDHRYHHLRSNSVNTVHSDQSETSPSTDFYTHFTPFGDTADDYDVDDTSSVEGSIISSSEQRPSLSIATLAARNLVLAHSPTTPVASPLKSAGSRIDAIHAGVLAASRHPPTTTTVMPSIPQQQPTKLLSTLREQTDAATSPMEDAFGVNPYLHKGSNKSMFGPNIFHHENRNRRWVSIVTPEQRKLYGSVWSSHCAEHEENPALVREMIKDARQKQKQAQKHQRSKSSSSHVSVHSSSSHVSTSPNRPSSLPRSGASSPTPSSLAAWRAATPDSVGTYETANQSRSDSPVPPSVLSTASSSNLSKATRSDASYYSAPSSLSRSVSPPSSTLSAGSEPLAVRTTKFGVVNTQVRTIWRRSGLTDEELSEIWSLVNDNESFVLAQDQFIVGMWLIESKMTGRKLPLRVSESLWATARGQTLDLSKLPA